MSGGHTHRFYVHGHSPVHALAPEAKVLATVLFVFVVVATPREAFWAFGAYAALIAGAALVAHIPLRHLATRLLVELPFLAFAFFLPFVGRGPQVEVLGVSLSEAGLWGMWNIVIKGTLGVAATVVLAATTSVPELIGALDRLRVPSILVQITSFMVRYLDVVGDDMRRMRIARESRGSDPRWRHHAIAVARTGGSLFVRTFERGERVHMAMLARGYDGRFAVAATPVAGSTDWVVAGLAPVVGGSSVPGGPADQQLTRNRGTPVGTGCRGDMSR